MHVLRPGDPLQHASVILCSLAPLHVERFFAPVALITCDWSRGQPHDRGSGRAEEEVGKAFVYFKFRLLLAQLVPVGAGVHAASYPALELFDLVDHFLLDRVVSKYLGFCAGRQPDRSVPVDQHLHFVDEHDHVVERDGLADETALLCDAYQGCALFTRVVLWRQRLRDDIALDLGDHVEVGAVQTAFRFNFILLR